MIYVLWEICVIYLDRRNIYLCVYVKYLKLFDVYLFIFVKFVFVYIMSVVLLDYKNI